MHSASTNAGALPSRYTLFTTMFHPEATRATVVTSPQASRAAVLQIPTRAAREFVSRKT